MKLIDNNLELVEQYSKIETDLLIEELSMLLINKNDICFSFYNPNNFYILEKKDNVSL